MKKLILAAALFVAMGAHAIAGEVLYRHPFQMAKSIKINAPISAVWKQLARVTELNWIPGVKNVTLSEKPARVGTHRMVTLTDGNVLDEVIREIKINKKLSFTIVKGLPFYEYNVDMILAPVYQDRGTNDITAVFVVAHGVSDMMSDNEINGFTTHVDGLYDQALKNLKTIVERKRFQSPDVY